MAPLVILRHLVWANLTGKFYPAIADMVTNNKDGLIFENSSQKDIESCLKRLSNEPDYCES
jgi:hypothetical protein